MIGPEDIPRNRASGMPIRAEIAPNTTDNTV